MVVASGMTERMTRRRHGVNCTDETLPVAIGNGRLNRTCASSAGITGIAMGSRMNQGHLFA